MREILGDKIFCVAVNKEEKHSNINTNITLRLWNSFMNEETRKSVVIDLKKKINNKETSPLEALLEI